MNSLNMTGRLTADPELRYTSGNNTAVASFKIAVDDGFAEKKKTYFFGCQAWTKTAENIVKFFKKGDTIAITGKLTQRSWDGNDGKKNSVVEIIVESFDFMGGKRSSTSQAGGQQEFDPLDDNEPLPF